MLSSSIRMMNPMAKEHIIQTNSFPARVEKSKKLVLSKSKLAPHTLNQPAISNVTMRTMVHQSNLLQTLTLLVSIRNNFITHRFGTFLTILRKLTINILFHQQSTDRYTEVGSPTTILYIDQNSYLRIVHRSKSHESRVVDAVILCCTGLTADLDARNITRTTGAMQYGISHASY